MLFARRKTSLHAIEEEDGCKVSLSLVHHSFCTIARCSCSLVVDLFDDDDDDDGGGVMMVS